MGNEETNMAHKKKHSGPVPPGNQAYAGPSGDSDQMVEKAEQSPAEVSSAQEQDPKRRLGDFTGKGEHSFQQPGGRNASKN
jgi:hypothetical protein